MIWRIIKGNFDFTIFTLHAYSSCIKTQLLFYLSVSSVLFLRVGKSRDPVFKKDVIWSHTKTGRKFGKMHTYPKIFPSSIFYLCDSPLLTILLGSQTRNWRSYLILRPQILSSSLPKYLSNLSLFSFTSKWVQTRLL